MKRRIFLFLGIIFLFMLSFTLTNTSTFAESYLSDKAETPVALNNTGARSICQTDDGYVWIGQFAGLNRYDSKELISFTSYINSKGEEETIENVRILVHYENTLFLVCSCGLLKYENHTFSKIDFGAESPNISNLIIKKDKLYICSIGGLYIYDIKTKELKHDSDHFENVSSIALNDEKIYIFKNDAVYDYDNNLIYEGDPVNSIYCFDDKLAIATKTGIIFFYDTKNNTMLSKSIILRSVSSQKGDMVHKFVYSAADKVLFAACEKGLYSINTETLEANYAKKLENNSKLVDIIIDYEGDLWIASYITGVSIISQSALVDLLFDVDSKIIPANQIVYAILRDGNDLYLATGAGIFVYDLTTGTINTSHPLNVAINEIIEYDEEKKKEIEDLEKRKVGFAESYDALMNSEIVYADTEFTELKENDVVFVLNDSTGDNIEYYEYCLNEAGTDYYFRLVNTTPKSKVIITNIFKKKDNPEEPDVIIGHKCEYDVRIPWYDVRDVEKFKGKIYFATYGSGLFEYNPATQEFHQYRGTDINPDDPTVNISGYYAVAQRCLKAYDDYLFIGTATTSIIRFDGTNFIYNSNISVSGGQILYIDESDFGKITFVASGNGIYTINENLENNSIESIPGLEEGTSGMLKFYQDDNYFYYNIYGRLFAVDTRDNTTHEIKIPFVNSSITEINKVKITDENGNISYKYVIASEKQVYIIEDLLADELNYEFYDSSNGLKSPIKGNSSGYYDEDDNIYYFQSQDGVFTYDFINKEEARVPLKIEVNSVKTDDKIFFGNQIKISKNTDRITFNISTFSVKPTKGYKIYYKLDGVDKDYIEADQSTSSVSYTNLNGGNYTFHSYVLDEYGQKSNEITINIIKPKKFFEEPGFWVILGILLIIAILVFNYFIIRRRTKKAIERQNEYKAITLESIEAIARTIDAKDSYTNGHSKRVGIYSREIARALKLPDDEIDNIYYIALLHDIGKISIPLEILNKPGRLTDEEFEIMKSHTTAGAKILDGITTIPHIVEGAKYHHERFGGGGYPTGISGEEIPFIARIICCADCYDAMATKRTYKEPYTKEKIISEFERCKGSQFDPKIADIVIKLIKEDRLRYGTELKSESKEKN